MAVIAEPIPKLPDPRRYAPAGRHPLLELAAASGPDAERKLVLRVRELLVRHADDELRRAQSLAPSREAYASLWRAICAASDGAGCHEEAVVATIFAMPLVIVTGAREAASVSGVLSDVGALADVLRGAGALGESRNFGLSNALCSLQALQQLPPSTILDWRVPDPAERGPRAIPPEPIAVRAGEEVHLRFLLGAAITPAAAPTVAETASHIGAWGMRFARALGSQLAVGGTELLAFPRPPMGVLKAAYHGRRAQLEAALNLFLSNSIKRMRAAAGEPSLVMSVHESGINGAELRVSMSASLDDTLLEGFRWPLHPLEDPNDIAEGICQFAADCRLTDVRVVESVLPEGGAGGVAVFMRAGDAALRAWHRLDIG
jgi:hypothetical protein